MSHHLDSPLARKDPRLNVTDQYVFNNEASTIFVMNVNTSLAGGHPGFHEEGRYEFKIHFDGAATEMLTYRFTFAEHVEDGSQTYEVHRLSGAEASDDSAAGSAIVANGLTGQEIQAEGGLRTWAGSALDPFYLDLDLLGIVNGAVKDGTKVEAADRRPEDWKNTFAGSTIQSIVLEIPSGDSELRSGREIAVWSTAKLATDAGGWRQVNRNGLPMIWPIFRRDDSVEASQANTTHPADDRENYGARITDLITKVVSGGPGGTTATAYADLVASRLIPDVLPYVIGTPAAFSFAGFNGRTLDDNAPEVMFSLVTNTAISSGLASERSSDVRAGSFPFVIPA